MTSDRILLVEDDVRVRHELRSALSAEGFAVTEAPDLARARGANPAEHAVVLLDLGLPDGDGLAF